MLYLRADSELADEEDQLVIETVAKRLLTLYGTVEEVAEADRKSH